MNRSPIERASRRIQRRLARLPLDARRELLRVLAAPPDVRADLIRQMYERPDTRELAEVLMDLEAEPLLRLATVPVVSPALGR